MRSSAATRPVASSSQGEAETLLRELHDTEESLQTCLAELAKVLAMPALDAGALTSVRLKLAGIRLTRGPLINKVTELLSGNVSESEEKMLEELRASHHRMLQVATAHTGQWTLDAIARDWSAYRRATRELVRQWEAKSQKDQRLVHPLVQRAVKLGWKARK